MEGQDRVFQIEVTEKDRKGFNIFPLGVGLYLCEILDVYSGKTKNDYNYLNWVAKTIKPDWYFGITFNFRTMLIEGKKWQFVSLMKALEIQCTEEELDEYYSFSKSNVVGRMVYVKTGISKNEKYKNIEVKTFFPYYTEGGE